MERKMIAWNTGALYQREGQRIAAVVIPEQSKVVFADVDRMVDGEFPLARVKDFDSYSLQQIVMNAYNFGNYTHYPADEDYSTYRALISELNKFAAANAPKLRGVG